MMNTVGVIIRVLRGRAYVLRMDTGRRAAFNKECFTLETAAPGHEASAWFDGSQSESSDDSDSDDEDGKFSVDF